jgi:hypothetical protein
MLSQENLTTLLNVIVPAIVAVAGIIIAWQTEKLRTMREQLSEKKYNAYADAVKMFYSVLKDAKANRTTNNKEMMDRMIDIKRDIFMYGSDKVFKAFNKWLLSTTNSNDKAQFAAFLDFVLEMRKDLCNNKTRLTKHDILLNLTQSEEEARKLFD